MLLGVPSCALAARVGTVGAGAALGSLAGPGGAAAGAMGGLIAYEAVEGDLLQAEVNKAALNGGTSVNVIPDFSAWIPWIVAAFLVFTPSGQYLFRKLRERISQSKTPKP